MWFRFPIQEKRMSENLLGWHQFGGKIIPKSVVEAATLGTERSPTRLQVGEGVKVKITDRGATSFVDAIVMDYHICRGNAVSYTLAFPINERGLFWFVMEDFNGAGGFSGLSALFGTTETADGSCLYTQKEYEAYQQENEEAAPHDARQRLKLVSA
jgi:hypothetical protein